MRLVEADGVNRSKPTTQADGTKQSNPTTRADGTNSSTKLTASPTNQVAQRKQGILPILRPSKLRTHRNRVYVETDVPLLNQAEPSHVKGRLIQEVTKRTYDRAKQWKPIEA